MHGKRCQGNQAEARLTIESFASRTSPRACGSGPLLRDKLCAAGFGLGNDRDRTFYSFPGTNAVLKPLAVSGANKGLKGASPSPA